MWHKIARIGVGMVTAFISVTAIGGGIAILTGVDEFPIEWLESTPFRSYVIPALILSIIVGGSSLVACISMVTQRRFKQLAIIAAGVIMVGYIVGEVLLLNQVPPGPTPIEMFYLMLGIIMLVYSTTECYVTQP